MKKVDLTKGLGKMVVLPVVYIASMCYGTMLTYKRPSNRKNETK